MTSCLLTFSIEDCLLTLSIEEGDELSTDLEYRGRWRAVYWPWVSRKVTRAVYWPWVSRKLASCLLTLRIDEGDESSLLTLSIEEGEESSLLTLSVKEGEESNLLTLSIEEGDELPTDLEYRGRWRAAWRWRCPRPSWWALSCCPSRRSPASAASCTAQPQTQSSGSSAVWCLQFVHDGTYKT